MKKLLFLTSLLIVFGFLFAEKAIAGTGDNVSGFAWSENIGWINFNGSNYGVNVSPLNGKLSGFAWSENIGWISFNESDTGAPPSNDPCSDTFIQAAIHILRAGPSAAPGTPPENA